MHIRDRVIRPLKRRVTNKPIPLTKIRIIPRNLRRRSEWSKPRESLEKRLLIRHGIQIPHEQLRPNSLSLPSLATHSPSPLISARLVDPNRLPPQADLIHGFGGIVGVVFGAEFDEAVALVGLGDAIFGEVDVEDGAGLQHEFPDEAVGAALVEVADVEGAVFVLVVVAGGGHCGW